MKHIVIGSFLGFVLGAAFLAACGGGGGDDPPAPPPITVSGAVRWTPLGAPTLIGTGIDLSPGTLWSSTAVYENGGAARHQYAAIEIRADADGANPVLVDVGVLPALDGTNFATEPQWLGSMALRPADNRRATLTGVLVPPTRMRLALRVTSGTARVLTFSIGPYDVQFP